MYSFARLPLLLICLSIACGRDSQTQIEIPNGCIELILDSYYGCDGIPTSADNNLQYCNPPIDDFSKCNLVCGSGQPCIQETKPPQLFGRFGDNLTAGGTQPRIIELLPDSEHQLSVAGLSNIDLQQSTTWFPSAIRGKGNTFTIYQANKKRSGDCADYEFVAFTGRLDRVCDATTISEVVERHFMLNHLCGLPAGLTNEPQLGRIENKSSSWSRLPASRVEPSCSE